MRDAMITFAILLYDLILVAGTAYLVTVHSWSMWTFVLTVLLHMSTRNSKESKPEPEKKKSVILGSEDSLNEH